MHNSDLDINTDQNIPETTFSRPLTFDVAPSRASTASHTSVSMVSSVSITTSSRQQMLKIHYDADAASKRIENLAQNRGPILVSTESRGIK